MNHAPRLRAGRHAHDPRWCASPEEGQELTGDEKVRKVIHLETELVPVGAFLAGCVRLTASDPSVVDEEVQAVIVTLDRVNGSPHLSEGAEIGLDESGRAPGGLGLLDHGLTALNIAAVHDDVGARSGEGEGDGPPEAPCRPRDHDDLPSFQVAGRNLGQELPRRGRRQDDGKKGG